MNNETSKQTQKRGPRVPETRNQNGSECFLPEPDKPAWSKYKHFDLLKQIGQKSMRLYVAPLYFPIQKFSRVAAEALRQEILIKRRIDFRTHGYPKADDGTFIEGMLMYECYNKQGLAWIRNLGREPCYKVFTGGALLRPYQFTVTFPESAPCTTRKILHRVTTENGIPTENWEQLIRVSAIKKSTLKLKIDEQSYETLGKIGFILQYKGLPIRMHPIKLNLDDPGADLEIRMEKLHSLKRQKKLSRKARRLQRQTKSNSNCECSSCNDGTGPSCSSTGNQAVNNQSFDINQFLNGIAGPGTSYDQSLDIHQRLNSVGSFGNLLSNGQSDSDFNQFLNSIGILGNQPSNNQFLNNFENRPVDDPVFENNQFSNGVENIGNHPFSDDGQFSRDDHLDENPNNQHHDDQFQNLSVGGNFSNGQIF